MQIIWSRPVFSIEDRISSCLRLFFGAFAAGGLCLCAGPRVLAQALPLPDIAAAMPDSPQPQIDALPGGAIVKEQAAPQQNTAPTPQLPPATTGGSQPGAGTPVPAAGPEKSDREKAEEQLKEQEHQRVAGVMATFNTTRNRDALPLSPGQKFRLFFRSSTDPWPFLLAGVVAGIGQADNSPTEWGQGLQGYAKRFGGNYTDAFIGNFFGNAVLPVILREDPRYFQKGSGSHIGRVLWAASSTFWCRRDNGKWGPNYANVGGNMIGSAIARAYYPESERDAYDTIMDGFTVSVEGIVGAEVIEFWPDLVRRHKRKHDEKMARRAAQTAGNR